jgi:hypothetical protein
LFTDLDAVDSMLAVSAALNGDGSRHDGIEIHQRERRGVIRHLLDECAYVFWQACPTLHGIEVAQARMQNRAALMRRRRRPGRSCNVQCALRLLQQRRHGGWIEFQRVIRQARFRRGLVFMHLRDPVANARQ